MQWLIARRAPILAVGAISAIAAGFMLSAFGHAAAGRWVWRVAVAVLAGEVVRSVVVEHSLGVDAIALVAMVGALALGQELAGAVIGLMFSGGAALETLASRQARRELTSLVQRAPKHTQLRDAGGSARSRSTRYRRATSSSEPARWCPSTAPSSALRPSSTRAR